MIRRRWEAHPTPACRGDRLDQPRRSADRRARKKGRKEGRRREGGRKQQANEEARGMLVAVLCCCDTTPNAIVALDEGVDVNAAFSKCRRRTRP